MLTFLELNGISVNSTDEEIIKVGFALADRQMDVEQLEQWLVDHS